MSREKELEDLKEKAKNGQDVRMLIISYLKDDDLIILKHFPHLTCLYLTSSELSNACVQHLSGLKHLEVIEGGVHNRITISGIRKLVGNPLRLISLEKVNLDRDTITILNLFSNTLSDLSKIYCKTSLDAEKFALNLPNLKTVQIYDSKAVYSLRGTSQLEKLEIQKAEENDLAFLENIKIKKLVISNLRNSGQNLTTKIPRVYDLHIVNIESISKNFWSNFPGLENLSGVKFLTGNKSSLKHIRELNSYLTMNSDSKIGEDLKQMSNLKKITFLGEDDDSEYRTNPSQEEWEFYFSLPQVLIIQVPSIFYFDQALPIEAEEYTDKYDLNHSEEGYEYGYQDENYYSTLRSTFRLFWKLLKCIYMLFRWLYCRLVGKKQEIILGLEEYEDGESEPEIRSDDYLPEDYSPDIEVESTLECNPQIMLHIRSTPITYLPPWYDIPNDDLPMYYGSDRYIPSVSERMCDVKANLVRYHCLPKVTRLCLERFEYRGNSKTIVQRWSQLRELRMPKVRDHRKSFWWDLVKYTPLKKLHLETATVYQQMWLALKEISDLELSLFAVEEKTPGYHFEKMKDLQLRKLHLLWYLDCKNILRHFESWKNLEELHISDDLKEDWSILENKEMKVLHICDIKICKDSWPKITKINAATFHFSNVEDEKSDDDELSCGMVETIESLLGDCYHLQLQPKDEVAKKWNYFNEDWSIPTWTISDKVLIRNLTKMALKNVKRISLNAPRVDDELVQEIVKKSRVLENVDLSNTYISKKAIESLSTLPNLHTLSLYNSSIGVDCLDLLKNMNLKSVNVERTDLDGLL